MDRFKVVSFCILLAVPITGHGKLSRLYSMIIQVTNVANDTCILDKYNYYGQITTKIPYDILPNQSIVIEVEAPLYYASLDLEYKCNGKNLRIFNEIRAGLTYGFETNGCILNSSKELKISKVVENGSNWGYHPGVISWNIANL